MDRKLPKDQEIERLIRLGEAARTCLEHEAVLLKERLDVPARIRSSLKEHPAGWLLGSLASGLAASLLLRLSHAPPVRPAGLICLNPYKPFHVCTSGSRSRRSIPSTRAQL